jgi:predicted nucleic acid-binding protein
VAEFPAINTSPLIFLTKGNCLSLLQAVSEKVIVPEAVATEVQAYGNSDVTAQALAKTEWLIIKETPSIPSLIQSWDLGPGESAVLSWGYSYGGSEVIIDDLMGRRCAEALKIPVRGTLGIVLLAKQQGVISKARPILEMLKQSGMYLSENVLSEALKLVDE